MSYSEEDLQKHERMRESLVALENHAKSNPVFEQQTSDILPKKQYTEEEYKEMLRRAMDQIQKRKPKYDMTLAAKVKVRRAIDELEALIPSVDKDKFLVLEHTLNRCNHYTISADNIQRQYKIVEYSGRGMNGDRCPGVVCDEYFDFVSDLMKRGIEREDLALFGDIFKDARGDNMGTSVVVYFPRIKLPKNFPFHKDIGFGYCTECQSGYDEDGYCGCPEKSGKSNEEEEPETDIKETPDDPPGGIDLSMIGGI